MIAAVVLNYRTADDTALAVLSLQAGNTPVSPVIVVDNGSDDDSLQRLRSLAGVEVLALPANVGFSAGCNAGIARALESGAAAVLVVNSDVIVPPDTPGALRAALDADESFGIIGPVIRMRSDPGRVESAGIDYSQRTGRMRLRANGLALSSLPPFGVQPVDAVSGCAMLVKRQVFQRAGMFADDYFFGFEDLDLCLRARTHGFRTACVGTTFVLHEGQRSIGRMSGRRTHYATRNHLLLSTRHPAGSSRIETGVRLSSVLALNLAHALRGTEVSRLTALSGCVRGVRDFLAGRFGSVDGVPVSSPGESSPDSAWRHPRQTPRR